MKTLILILFPFLSIAQFKLKPIEPKEAKEGQKVSFQAVFDTKQDSLTLKWGLNGNTNPSMKISSEGVFSWIPDFKTVGKSEAFKVFDFYISASARRDSLILKDSILVNLTIKNANQPPVVPKNAEIIWVSKPNMEMQKNFPKEYYYDEEGDLLAFRLVNNVYQNLKLSPDGNMSVSLGYKELKALPDTLVLEVFEQNTEERLVTEQKIVLKRAEIDVAPVIRLMPDSPKYQIEETDELAIEIIINDENNDLKTVDFYTIPQTDFKIKDYLEKTNTDSYFFKWKPPLDFIKPNEPSKVFQMVISAIDEAKQVTTKQIEVEILNKIDWKIEDVERELNYNKVVMNAAEVYIRLENTFHASEKGIKRMLKNKNVKNFASKALGLLTQSASLIKDEETQKKLNEYSELSKGAIEMNNNSATFETEFPNEYSQINRFAKIIKSLKEIFVDTEQFIEIYKYPLNRRKDAFITNKAELLKELSLVNKDVALQLIPLKTETFNVKDIFQNF